MVVGIVQSTSKILHLQIDVNGAMQLVLLRQSDIKTKQWLEEIGKTDLPEQTENKTGVV